jgi:MFS family permease
VPWYSRATMIEELSRDTTQTSQVSIDLPDDTNKGTLGLIWILAAMLPVSIGASILSPSLNSLITRRVSPLEVGTILGISASMVSLANAITPLIGGALFQWLGSSAPFAIGGIVMLLLLVAAVLVINDGPEDSTAEQ